MKNQQVIVTGFGNIDRLKLVDAPLATLAPKDVRIKILEAGGVPGKIVIVNE